MKVTPDIQFINLCKVERIMTTFDIVEFSVKSGSRTPKLRNVRLLVEKETQSKHLKNKKEKKELQLICIHLKSVLE